MAGARRQFFPVGREKTRFGPGKAPSHGEYPLYIRGLDTVRPRRWQRNSVRFRSGKACLQGKMAAGALCCLFRIRLIRFHN